MVKRSLKQESEEGIFRSNNRLFNFDKLGRLTGFSSFGNVGGINNLIRGDLIEGVEYFNRRQ